MRATKAGESALLLLDAVAILTRQHIQYTERSGVPIDMAPANVEAVTKMLRTVCVVAVVGALSACGHPVATGTGTSSGPPPHHSAATTRQVMLAMTVPTSNAVFAAGGEAPADDAAWALAEANAVMLAESGQFLKSGARPVDAQNWMQFSNALITAAESAAQAAHEKNSEKLSAASDAIYQTCENCHKQYLIAKTG
jgi:hypothetical protein